MIKIVTKKTERLWTFAFAEEFILGLISKRISFDVHCYRDGITNMPYWVVEYEQKEVICNGDI